MILSLTSGPTSKTQSYEVVFFFIVNEEKILSFHTSYFSPPQWEGAVSLALKVKVD